VYTGDFLRLGFYLFLVVGAASEIHSYWSRIAHARVAEERARLARTLHDGLAQELVFVAGQSRRVARRPTDERELERLTSAVDRAVAEARRAIAVLAQDRDRSLADEISEMVEQIQAGEGAQFKLDLDPNVSIDGPAKEELLRITREAIVNALRHGRPESVKVRLQDDDGVRISVADDGAGFDSGNAQRSRPGFGLVTMRERAQALGGRMTVSSRPGEGTEVEIVVPSERPA
jgi:signal transduction histidine kinase